MQLKYFIIAFLFFRAIDSLRFRSVDNVYGFKFMLGKNRSKISTSAALEMKLPKIYASHLALTGSISWLLHSYFGVASALFYAVGMLSINILSFVIFRLDNFSLIKRKMKCSNALHHDKQLYNLVQSVAKSSNIPPVKGVWIVPTSELNAFACGTSQRNSNIMVTKGLRDQLSFQELKAVIAHECGHIKNKDMSMKSHLIPILMSYNFLFKHGSDILRAIRYRKKAQQADTYDEVILDTTFELLDYDEKNNANKIKNKSKSKWIIKTKKETKKQSKEELAQYCGYFLYTVGGASYLLGNLLTLFASRRMEFDADYHAAMICGKNKMISALRKINDENELSILGRYYILCFVKLNLYNVIHILYNILSYLFITEIFPEMY